MTQLAIEIRCCKVRDCTAEVVASSITGKGHVCKRHNEIEWGKALATYDPEMSRKLLGAAV
jgi:hypothetical protein